MFIWEQPHWPDWQFDMTSLGGLLAAVRHQQGRLIGRMSALGFGYQDEAELASLTLEVLKTSEIEGESLAVEQVRSSLARQLGIAAAALVPADRHVDGVVDMMLDATRNYRQPLSRERLFAWHGALFPTGRSGLRQLRVGCWRNDLTGPMQVVSGAFGREKVHYQAPPATELDQQTDRFFEWFNSEKVGLDPVLKAALAHLWFVTLHPFEDGNGRIARAIGDMALARSEGQSRRFYSLSAQLRKNRSGYYRILEQTQRGCMDVTPWLGWFLENLSLALSGAEDTVAQVLRKSRFWDRYRPLGLNERQVLLLNRLLDGFEGKLTSSKWAQLAKCSQDTALRDISALLEAGVLYKQAAGGRSTGYELTPEGSNQTLLDP